MSIVAVIPARGGSKGIPRKNLALCGGRPLVDWTIEAANRSRHLTDALLSSDSPEILARATGRVRPHLRPDALSQDDTPTEPVIADAIEALGYMPDVIVLLQPTSPLREWWHIDGAIETLLGSFSDSVVSATEAHTFRWKAGGSRGASAVPLYDPEHRPRRQEFAEYDENGAVYATTGVQWKRTGCRVGGRTRLYLMTPHASVQVDTPEDLLIVDALMKERMAVAA